MAELTRVPAPRSPFDGWRGRVVSVIVIGILVAIAKPWGEPHAPTLPVAPSPAPSSAPVVVAPVGQIYDPAVFAAEPPAADWAVVTPGGTTPIAFVDPSAAEAADDAVIAGPVIDLGPPTGLAAIAIAHPRDVSVATVRMWQFVEDGAPRRVHLDAVPSPWPAARHVEVVAHRRPGMRPDRVLAWEPGLYRLDLLVEPADRVRSLMLSVGADRSVDAPIAGADEAPRASPSFTPSTLRLLPEAANLWSAGAFLSGWRRGTANAGCRVAEIWRATDPRDDCWPVPIGRTEAVGVNLANDAIVASIALLGIDPLPGPVTGTAQTWVGGHAGRALVRAPAGGLPDGIYRLDVATDAGDRLTWYLEVGPIGRAVAYYYEASTSR